MRSLRPCIGSTRSSDATAARGAALNVGSHTISKTWLMMMATFVWAVVVPLEVARAILLS